MSVDRVSQTEPWPSTLKLVDGVMAGDRGSLSRAITLSESTRSDHRDQAEIVLDRVLAARRDAEAAVLLEVEASRAEADRELKAAIAEAHRLDTTHKRFPTKRDEPGGKDTLPSYCLPTFRVGIAGPPGAGKSTFIEALGLNLVSQGHRVAVLAIDPSSSRTKGSILGDKTRMHDLSRHLSAYVRPSPSRGALGGIAMNTHDAVLLCEGAGYDVVLIETVGLGQSEVVVDDTVDMFTLLLPPGGGDELQGVKKGVMEVADLVIVNKADGALATAAEQSRIDEAWRRMHDFRLVMSRAGEIVDKRRSQTTKWMWSSLHAMLTEMVNKDEGVQALARELEPDLILGQVAYRRASAMLLQRFLQSHASAERNA